MAFFAMKYDAYVFSITVKFYLGLAIILMGLIILASAAIGFKREKTTINPFQPEKASSLVVDGVYTYTRNPMYLGMAVILLGVHMGLGFSPNILLVIIFVLYISQFQIKHEERALIDLFGADYENYMKRVRRWI